MDYGDTCIFTDIAPTAESKALHLSFARSVRRRLAERRALCSRGVQLPDPIEVQPTTQSFCKHACVSVNP